MVRSGWMLPGGGAAKPLLLASRAGRLVRKGWRWWSRGGCCRWVGRHSRFCWLFEQVVQFVEGGDRQVGVRRWGLKGWMG